MAKLHERTIKPSEKRRTQSRRKELTEADAPSVERFPGILVGREDGVDDMPTLSAEYLSLHAEGTRIEARKKEIREIFEGMLVEAGEAIVQGDFFVTEVVTSHSPKKLSDTRLLEEGVNIEVINNCWVGGEEFCFIKISAKE